VEPARIPLTVKYFTSEIIYLEAMVLL